MGVKDWWYYYRPLTQYDGKLCFHRCVSVHRRVLWPLILGPFLGKGYLSLWSQFPSGVGRERKGGTGDTPVLVLSSREYNSQILGWVPPDRTRTVVPNSPPLHSQSGSGQRYSFSLSREDQDKDSSSPSPEKTRTRTRIEVPPRTAHAMDTKCRGRYASFLSSVVSSEVHLSNSQMYSSYKVNIKLKKIKLRIKRTHKLKT